MNNLKIHFEYMNFVAQHLKPDIANAEPYDKFRYLIFKLFSETGEFIGQFCKKEFHNPQISKETLIDEAGDCLWYIYYIIYTCDPYTQETIFRYIDNITEQKRITKLANINLARMADECGNLAKLWIKNFITEAKPTLTTEFLTEFKWFIYYFIGTLKSLDFDLFQIIESNIEKIKDRHGGTYNQEFYQTNEAIL